MVCLFSCGSARSPQKRRCQKVLPGLGIAWIAAAVTVLGETSVYADELVRTQSRTFDALGRLSSAINADGATTTFEHDNNGNLTRIRAPLGRDITIQYDELNRLTQVIDPDGGITHYAYDQNDNLISVIDPRNLQTTYSYNGFGDLTQEISPDAGTTTYTYDSGGNLSTRTDARGKIGTFSYDAINRLTQTQYSDQTHTFTYDNCTYGISHLCGIVDGSGTTSWTYTPHGRVATKQQTTNGKIFNVAYGYSNGRLTSITTPSGQVIGYSYANGRITGVTLNDTPVVDQVVYQAFGPIQRWTWGNGTVTTRNYDLDGRLTANHSAGTSTYSYYADGTIQSITQDAQRVVSTQTGTTTLTPASNSNRLASTSGAFNRIYNFDVAGNVISDGARGFTYSDAGRMSSATMSGIVTVYSYNAIGQRVKKSNSNGITYFLYDEAGRLLGEYAANGDRIQELVWLDDIPVATIRTDQSGNAAGVFYIHTDQLNAPTKITRPADNHVIWRWDHDPYGNGVVLEDPDGNGQRLSFNLRFSWQYADQETGLNYNYFRDYDPATGSYYQSDPIGLSGGINTYAYVDSNPVSFIDPLGLAKCTYSITSHTLVCESDDHQQVGTIGPENVLSGEVGECRNNPDCADRPNIGPVPPGTYDMIPSSKYDGSWQLQPGFWSRLSYKMGMGRGEFFLHLGYGVSHGCITVIKTDPLAKTQFEAVRKILNGDPKNSMKVIP